MANRNIISPEADFTSYGAAAEVTPSDDTDLGYVKGLYVGTSETGNVLVVTMADGALVSFETPAAGTILPLRVQRVMAATTCADIVALY